MKKCFLLAIIMTGFSHSVFAMEQHGITTQHLKDMVQLACAINNHDLQAYESYPGKENLTYASLKHLSEHNAEVVINLMKERLNLGTLSRLWSLQKFNTQLAAHQQIGQFLSVLLDKQIPIKIAADREHCNQLAQLAEYKAIYEHKQREDLLAAVKRREELLALSQQAENKQENSSDIQLNWERV